MKSFTLKTILFTALLLFFSCGNDDEEPTEALQPELSVADLVAETTENPEDGSILGQFAVTQANLTAPLVFELTEVGLSGALTIDNEGQLVVTDVAAFDFEVRETITGEIEVSSGALSRTASFTINILDVDEPELAVADLVVEVMENPEDGSILGQFEITQANLADSLVFELTTVEPAGSVTIDGEGQLLVADVAAFDFEVRETITGEIEVSSGALSQTASFTINILDVDDAVPFITQWNLTGIELTLVLPLYSGDAEDMTEYNFSVDWGDGSEIETVIGSGAGHSYSSPGLKTVTITGILKGFNFFENDISKDVIVDVIQWGDMRLGNAERHFFNCTNLIGFTAMDSPILDEVTILDNMFFGANSFNADLSGWDVSNVTSMVSMFDTASSFNGGLSSWDVSNVTTMSRMFAGASSFNGDLSNWDLSNVTIMEAMFFGASSFNGDISSWDVSNVVKMDSMFGRTESFNGDLSGWDVSNVFDMGGMFAEASSFNGDLSSWDVSNVENMAGMFSDAITFNGDISSWDVSSVRSMDSTFRGAESFNRDISSWDVSNVQFMDEMFQEAISFSADLSGWDVSNVDDMDNMFDRASSFSADLSSWATDNVTECVDFSTGSALTQEQLPTRGCFQQ